MSARDNPQQPRTCAVLGGGGFVGSAIVAVARQLGWKVDSIDLAEYQQARGKHFDILINADGNSKKFLAADDPPGEFDLSVRSTIRALHDFHAERYVHLSTIDVYPDHADPANNSEDSSIDPSKLTPYGFHKYLAEEIARYYSADTLIFRMGGFVGPGLWKNSIYDLLRGHPLRVHPDSSYQYLHTHVLARIVLDLAADPSPPDRLFNICGRGLVSLREVADLIPDCHLPEDSPAQPSPEHYEINISRISALYEIPETRRTVADFVKAVLEGKEQIR